MERRVDVDGVVYGVRLRGRLPAPFQQHLWPAASGTGAAVETVELTYEAVDSVPAVEGIWESANEGGGSEERFVLSRLPDGFGLLVAGDAAGHFRCTERRIHVHWAGPAGAAPHYLFAYALPLWLETRGVPVLHGSAVAVGGRVAAFLGASGVGKSVLCAELLRLGCGFVADDGLALTREADGAWRCLPGPPLLRLWPSGLVGRLELTPEALARVRTEGDKRWLPLSGLRPGVSPPKAEPDGSGLASFYVLERRPEETGPVDLTHLSPREALVRLLEHGVAAAPAAALGHAARRLETLAAVAETVPVRHLAYPSAPDSAGRVLAAVEQDLEARPSRAS